MKSGWCVCVCERERERKIGFNSRRRRRVCVCTGTKDKEMERERERTESAQWHCSRKGGGPRGVKAISDGGRRKGGDHRSVSLSRGGTETCRGYDLYMDEIGTRKTHVNVKFNDDRTYTCM